MRFSILAALAAFFAAATLCLMGEFPLQVFFLLLCLALFFMALCAAVTATWLKYLCITVFTLLIPLTLAEGYFYHLVKKEVGINVQRGGIFAKGLARPDADIGYAPVPNSKVQSHVVRDGKEVYNVTYTLNDKGWRVTPEAPDADTAVLLFGCSFTFGEGLNDKETLAWKLGEELGPRYKVYNFGFSGYGPHHMQAIIERGLPELAKYKNIQAYHIAIRGHQRRVAGISPWDRNGPRYVLTQNAQGKPTAVRQGTFADNPPFFWEGELGPYFERSFIFKGLKQQLSEQLVPLNTLDARLKLTRAIIESSAESLRAQWPQSHFRVLAWPPDAMELLQGHLPTVPVLDVQQWLPGNAQTPEKYKIPGDSHPNAHANALAAQKLADTVRTSTGD